MIPATLRTTNKRPLLLQMTVRIKTNRKTKKYKRLLQIISRWKSPHHKLRLIITQKLSKIQTRKMKLIKKKTIAILREKLLQEISRTKSKKTTLLESLVQLALMMAKSKIQTSGEVQVL